MSRTFTPKANTTFVSDSKTPDKIIVSYTPFFDATNTFFAKLASMAPEQQATGEPASKNKSTYR